jgi:hypothetical protein
MKNLTTNATISEVPRLKMSTPYNGILSKYSTEKKKKLIQLLKYRLQNA